MCRFSIKSLPKRRARKLQQIKRMQNPSKSCTKHKYQCHNFQHLIRSVCVGHRQTKKQRHCLPKKPKRRSRTRYSPSFDRSLPRLHSSHSLMEIVLSMFLYTPMLIARYLWNGATAIRRRSRTPKRCNYEALALAIIKSTLW